MGFSKLVLEDLDWKTWIGTYHSKAGAGWFDNHAHGTWVESIEPKPAVQPNP